jgi:hypothetical protein
MERSTFLKHNMHAYMHTRIHIIHEYSAQYPHNHVRLLGCELCSYAHNGDVNYVCTTSALHACKSVLLWRIRYVVGRGSSSDPRSRACTAARENGDTLFSAAAQTPDEDKRDHATSTADSSRIESVVRDFPIALVRNLQRLATEIVCTLFPLRSASVGSVFKSLWEKSSCCHCCVLIWSSYCVLRNQISRQIPYGLAPRKLLQRWEGKYFHLIPPELCAELLQNPPCRYHLGAGFLWSSLWLKFSSIKSSFLGRFVRLCSHSRCAAKICFAWHMTGHCTCAFFGTSTNIVAPLHYMTSIVPLEDENSRKNRNNFHQLTVLVMPQKTCENKLELSVLRIRRFQCICWKTFPNSNSFVTACVCLAHHCRRRTGGSGLFGGDEDADEPPSMHEMQNLIPEDERKREFRPKEWVGGPGRCTR